MACANISIPLDPMIATILAEINTAPRLLASLRLYMAKGGELTTMHNNVIHLTDEALNLYYEYKEQLTTRPAN